MSFKNIVKDDFGQPAKITFKDVDTDAAADISGYSSTIQMIFTKPDGTSVTKTAAFDSDGSDGVIAYTVESGVFDTAGHWLVRGRVASGSATLTTVEHSFRVLE